MKSPFYLQDHE
jgi:hypothetical protein